MQRRLREEEKRLHDVRAGLDSDNATAGLPDESQFGDLATYDQHPADTGSETFEREKQLAIGEQVDAQIKDVQEALGRIEDGSFGKCLICGTAIPDERLEARPMARYCLEHQKQVEDGVHPGIGDAR